MSPGPIDVHTRSYRLRDLQLNIPYTIQVTAYDRVGGSPPSQMILPKTTDSKYIALASWAEGYVTRKV